MKRNILLALALVAGLAGAAAAGSSPDVRIAKSTETVYSVAVDSANAYVGFSSTLVDVAASKLDGRATFCVQNATTTAGVNLWCANRAQDAVVSSSLYIGPGEWHCPNVPTISDGVAAKFYCRNDSANSQVKAVVVQKD